MSFTKYLSQFKQNTEHIQTHLAFKGGKYNVPDTKYTEFYKKYYDTIINQSEDLFLIEKVHDTNFAFFLDIDGKKQNCSDADISNLIVYFQTVIKTIFKQNIEDEKLIKFIVSKRINKELNCSNYHVNFYNLVINSNIASLILQEVNKLTENKYINCLDSSVYRTGLRLLGSKKNITDSNDEYGIYKIYDLNNGIFKMLKQTLINNEDICYILFKYTIVRKPNNTPTTELDDKYQKILKQVVQKTPKIKGVTNGKIKDEIIKMIDELKQTEEGSILNKFNTNIDKICAKPNKMGVFCYYITIHERTCPFKEREHMRESYVLYIEINNNGLYIKCFDSECLKRHYPENGIRLPKNMEQKYPNLYQSMSTRYWKSEITLTDENKQYLEQSLCGTHFKIAKAIFQIYKDRFRVDDIKNTDWYEYDGIRWKKSYLMNILISEELPKYYRGIKISDTSLQNNNLQEFLENSEKIDANVRNQIIDKIITQLENVSFKNNIINQLVSLFKNHDPDFYKQLDSNPYLLGFKDGIYDFKTNQFRKGDPKDYLTYTTGYEYIDYDPNNPIVQEIYEFLSQIITNKEVFEFTLKVLGKSLFGSPDERFYILNGVGSNGKSSLFNLIEATLGDYATAVDTALLTNKRANSGNASPDIIRLKGRRYMFFQEPNSNDTIQAGLLKQLSGGDSLIARELFKAPISFKLQAAMFMACNELPILAMDGGIHRRIRVIEFTSRFCDNPVKPNEFKIKPELKFKINGWRPYFMSILIHYYHKYIEEGLYEPDVVKIATDNYKIENDKYNDFINEFIEDDQFSFESNKTIYTTVFKSWWIDNYPTTKIPDIKELRRALKLRFGTEKTKDINNIRTLGFPIRIKNKNMLNLIESPTNDINDINDTNDTNDDL